MKRILPTCAAALLLTACFGPGSPASILRNPDASELARVSAVDQLSDTKLLWRMALSNAPFPVRKAAAARVLALDEDGFWRKVEGDYKGIDGVMWKWICKEAGERKEKRALRAMVLKWGRLDLEVAEEKRPERSAIAQITKQVPEDFLVAVVEGKEMTKDGKAQKMAFLALARNWGGMNLKICRDLMRKIPVNSELDALHTLCVLSGGWISGPTVEEEIEILKVQSKFWKYPFDPDIGVEARCLPILRRHPDCLNDAANKNLPVFPSPIPRTTDAPLLSKTPPSSTDTAVCAEILRGLRANPSLVAALFKEADRDLSDTRTEHGGLLLWNDNNEVVFEAVAPEMRSHDGTYLPPESLFVKLRDGLAHVHFHAQKHDNGEYAGPGRGDLIFSENNRVNAVVFTFVDENTLNVDAFFPGKIVVDLGCIRRQK